MKNNDIDIKITTTADTAAVEKADAAVRKLNGTVSVGTTDDFLDRTADKARYQAGAFYDLDDAVNKTTRSNETFTAGTTAVTRGTTNASQSLLLFSQGFEDAQYGIRGVLNNIPGLILSLGGTAGLAGAISIAAVAGSVLFEWLNKTEEKADDVADRIKAIADNMGEAEVDRFEEFGSAIEAAAEATAALKQGWDETQKAETEFATAALSNAEKLEIAQRNIAEALGLQVDRFRELDAIAKQADAARKLAADQAIATENQRIEKAKEAATLAGDDLQKERQRADLAAVNLVRLREELAALRQKRDELEKIAKEGTDEARRQDAASPYDTPGQAQNQVRSAASSELESGPFRQLLAGTQQRVDRLEELIAKVTGDSGSIAKAENALRLAQTQVTDIESAVSVNIDRITETLSADTLVAKSGELVKTGEQLAASIQESFGQIETTNQRGLAAREALNQAAGDGKITADEMVATAANLQTLVGLIQSGQASYNGNVVSLIALQRSFATTQTGIIAEIESLKNQVIGIQARSSSADF
jgi:hypothetical protein